MAFKSSQQVMEAARDSGVRKAALTPDRQLVSGVMGGAFIAFGSLVAISVTGGLDPARWGTLPNLFYGLTFSTGLILVVLLGTELVTSNMGLLPMAVLDRKARGGPVVRSIVLVTAGNLVGSLAVAYFFAVHSGVIGTAKGTGPAHLLYTRLAAIGTAKAVTESGYEIFLRAIACNMLVVLAVLAALAAEDVAGKILAIIFPITAFVAMGFDHVVANFFFLPAAMFAHVPGITAAHVVPDILIAYAGNLLGAAVFVGAVYWYLDLRGETATDGGPVTTTTERLQPRRAARR